MRILITGCKGQLGSEIIKQLKQKKSEIGLIPKCYNNATVIGVDLDDFDLSDKQAVKENLRSGSYDIVFNCAAFTNVNACETNQDTAFAANALAIRNLAEVCENTATKLVHISTDYVFAGDGTEPYREYDETSPVTIYGKTKLAGERYIQERCRRHFVLRTAWLYGYNGNNFVKTIMRAAKEKGELKVVNDQMGNPTSAADLAHHMLEIAQGNRFGIYHCTNNGICSWYDFAKEIVKLANIPCTIVPCSTKEFSRSDVKEAKRPAYSALDNMMLRLTTGDHMRDWQDALKEYISKVKL